jgi:NAD(P)-dependent dehydrogenase (short-subunit alcohol dehydrogenase family)
MPAPVVPPDERDSEAALNGETPHEQARRLVGRALAKNLGREGFDVLALRLRQDYARTLTERERTAALEYVEERVELMRAMLRADGGTVEFQWPDNGDVSGG